MGASRSVFVGFAVLVAVGGGVWLLSRERVTTGGSSADSRSRPADEDPAPQLHGRADETASPAEDAEDATAAATANATVTATDIAPAADTPRPTLRGRLVTEDGGRLGDARAYLVPKGSPGSRGWRDVKARAEVENDGSWSLEADPRGHWIAGLAAGYRPVFVDGDAWAGEEVELRLPPGRRLEITTIVRTDSVRPRLSAFVYGLGDEGYEYPGPGSEPDVSTMVLLDRTDRAPVHVSMDGRIQVRVHAAGFVTEPEFVNLERGVHEAEFRVTLGCGVDLTPRDAETGYPLISDVEVAVFTADQTVEKARFHLLERFEGDLEEEGLAPGAYRIAVKSPGYEPWHSDVVELTRPGQQVALEPRLTPRAGAGRLLLEVIPPEGGSLEGALVSVVVGRTNAEGRLDWKHHARRARSEDRRHVLLTPLDVGEIHLLAWTGPVAVGWLGPVDVSGTKTDTARMTLVPGTVVQLRADAENPQSGAFYSGEVSATVRRSDGTQLPLAIFRSRQPPSGRENLFFHSAHERRDERLAQSSSLEPEAVLGPYPFADLVVEGPPHDLRPNTR